MGVAIGAASGLAALAFYQLLNAVAGIATAALGGAASTGDLGLVLSEIGSPPILAPLVILGGALVSSVIVYRLSPEAEGHGTDAAVKAFHRRAAQIPFKTGIVKAVASSILVGTGGSGGVEGPSVQIGASIGSTIARMLRLRIEDRRIALVAGMSGALSALFHAPLGSTFFAAEVLYKRDLEVQALVPAFISSITAYTLATIAGYEPPLPRLEIDGSNLYTPESIASYILLGIFLAPFGYLYARVFRESERAFRRLEDLGLPRSLRPVVGAAGLSLLIYAAPFAAGSGRGVLAAVLSGEPVSWLPVGAAGLGAALALAAAGLLKIAATSLSIGSGGSGGVFAPGLLGGALLGLSFYALLEGTADTPLPAMAYAYLGMSAFFAAAAKVPLATSIMVAEMGNNYLLIPPSLLASIVAREISGNTSIYSSQLLHRPPREVIDAEALLALLREKGIKVQLTAGQLADGGVKPVGPETPAGEVLKLMERGLPIVPVVDSDGRPVGVITPEAVEEAIEEGVDLSTTPASMLAYMEVPIVREDEGVDVILERMLTYESEAAIVVGKDGRYRGVVLAEEVIAALAYIIQEAGPASTPIRRRPAQAVG